jgi:hypothetical protein
MGDRDSLDTAREVGLPVDGVDLVAADLSITASSSGVRSPSQPSFCSMPIVNSG